MAMPPEEVDYKFLRLFRIIFGLCLADSALEDFIAGFHKYALLEPSYHFHYTGFSWMRPLPEPYFSGCYVLLMISALLFAAGYFWRVTSVLNLILYGYIHFIEKADYNNHYYLILILCFFFCLKEVPNGECKGPAWYLDLFRYQFALVYFFAGLAKWSRDWLLGEPLGQWMGPIAQYYGAPWLAEPYFVAFLAMSGLITDLLAGPALLHPRTRHFAVVGLIAFHSFNEGLFQIGVFPAMMIGSCLLFLGPTVQPPRVWKSGTAKIMAIFLLFQMLLPLRHYLIPGLSLWTEDGHRYSWRMKLRSKGARLHDLIVDGKPVNALKFLTQTQIRRMASRPDMIVQFAQYLKKEHGAKSVRMLITAKLNGRPKQIFVEPTTELTEASVSNFRQTTWIRPLEHPYLSKDSKYTRRALVLMLYSISLFGFIIGLVSKERKDLWPWTAVQLGASVITLQLFSNPELSLVGLLGLATVGLWVWSARSDKSVEIHRMFLILQTTISAVLGSVIWISG